MVRPGVGTDVTTASREIQRTETSNDIADQVMEHIEENDLIRKMVTYLGEPFTEDTKNQLDDIKKMPKATQRQKARNQLEGRKMQSVDKLTRLLQMVVQTRTKTQHTTDRAEKNLTIEDAKKLLGADAWAAIVNNAEQSHVGALSK